MRASKNGLPIHLRKDVRDLLAAGSSVARDGNRLLIDGPEALAGAVRAHAEELARYVVPAVDAKDAELVREPARRRRRRGCLHHEPGDRPAGGGRHRRRLS